MSRLVTLAFLCFLFLPSALWAQTTPRLTLPERPDVRIIVDISGSMKETDPNDLRQPAVRLLARVLPEGSTAGVWTFGQYVNMLVPHREVSDSWREMAVNRSQEINSVALRTNLGKAIEVASDDYVTGGSLHNTHFILLTDGQVDISDSAKANQAEEERILGPLLDGLVARGVTFHAVGLSDQADSAFLKTLAEKSKGSFRVVETADALNLAFLDALNTAAPQDQIPIEGNGFTVDSGVKEFTALIFRDKGKAGESNKAAGVKLVGPNGQTLDKSTQVDKVRWASEAAYDLVTVSDPQSGNWQVKGELGEGSRVTVVSDLKMVVSPIPATFTPESPIDVRIAFFEENEKMTHSDFLDVITVKLSLMTESGRSGSKALSAKDGVYTDTVSKLPAEGSYKINIVADGKTFARKFTATTDYIVPMGMVEPSIASPIDISLVEQPQQNPITEPDVVPEPEPEPTASVPAEPVEPSSVEKGVPEKGTTFPVPLWVVAAGVAAVLLFLLIFILLKRKRQDTEVADTTSNESEEGEGSESLDDLQQEMANIEAETPVLMPEPEPEPEDIPVASTVVEPEEAIPELVEPIKDSEEEAFGLEDFDLSEFDDLPDFDSTDDLEPGNEPDDEQKK